MASVAVVVFTRDLRVDDHPALARACATPSGSCRCSCSTTRSSARRSTDRTAPASSSSRSHDLDDALRALGGRARRATRATGCEEVAAIVRTVDAAAVHVSDDVSGYARARLDRLASTRRRPGRARTPGSRWSRPARSRRGRAGDHYKVFTPYFRRWFEAPSAPRGAGAGARRCSPTASIAGALPTLTDLVDGPRSPTVVPGGAQAGQARLEAWIESGLRGYADHHDDLPGDATSRLSPVPALRLPLTAGGAARRRGTTRARVPTRSCASCAGATSTRRSSPPAPTPRGPTTSTAATAGATTPTRSRRGRTGAPAIPSSTPAMRQLQSRGLHAQPGPHGRGVVPHQGPVRRLARRRPPLPRPARRRRPRQQQPELAVGRRHRHRHQPAPRVQPDGAGPALRSRRRLRAPLRARARARSRTAPSTTPTPRSAAPTTTPTPIVDHHEAVAEYKDRRQRPTSGSASRN